MKLAILSNFPCLIALIILTFLWHQAGLSEPDEELELGAQAAQLVIPSSQSAANSICSKVRTIKEPRPLKSKAELKTRFLTSHNDMRKRYGLPAFIWDPKIASYAQAWADELKRKHKCQMIHRSALNRKGGKQYGENLAWSWSSDKVAASSFKSSPEAGVLQWSRECSDWNYASNSCKAGKVCGHFTQVMWKETKRIGCGVAVCDGAASSKGQGHSEVWVCNYDPPGNMTINGVKQKPF